MADRTRILIPVSTNIYPYPSPSSLDAFEWTIQKLVRGNNGAFFIRFIHVQYISGDRGAAGGASLASMEARYNAIAPDGRDLLNQFVIRCRNHGVDCDSTLATGEIKAAICLEASTMRPHPDFIVLGHRGRRILDGQSLSAYLRENAMCPVLTIKNGALEG